MTDRKNRAGFIGARIYGKVAHMSQNENSAGELATERKCETNHWTKVLGIVSSIVGLIAFSFAIVTYVHNRVLIAQREKQQRLFLAATNRFTKTLEEKNEDFQLLSEKLDKIDSLYAKVDAIHKQSIRNRTIYPEGSSRQFLDAIYAR